MSGRATAPTTAGARLTTAAALAPLRARRGTAPRDRPHRTATPPALLPRRVGSRIHNTPPRAVPTATPSTPRRAAATARRSSLEAAAIPKRRAPVRLRVRGRAPQPALPARGADSEN